MLTVVTTLIALAGLSIDRVVRRLDIARQIGEGVQEELRTLAGEFPI